MTNTRSKSSFDSQGHRGCRGLMPENTIAAMIKALDFGVTTLEMDVVITKDKEVILSHEPFFSHEITTKPDGSVVTETEEKRLNIFEMNYDEVKGFDVGLKPHPRFPNQKKIKTFKPLLSDVIDAVEKQLSTANAKVVYYNIETKSKPHTDGIYHPAPKEFVDLLMKVVLAKNLQHRVIIQSFDIRTLQYLHKHHPSIKTALLIEDFDKRSLNQQLQELGFIPDIYSPEYSHVTSELIIECHKRKMKLIPWTVNEKAVIDRLRELGVDGIISDFPNLLN